MTDEAKIKATARKLVPLAANDATRGKMILRDGVIKAATQVNLFDMAGAANQPMFSQFSYAGLVADGGRVSTIFIDAYLPIKGKEVIETFAYTLPTWESSFFRRQALEYQAPDSGDRQAEIKCMFDVEHSMTTIEGIESKIMKTMGKDFKLHLSIRFSASVNLKCGDIYGVGHILIPDADVGLCRSKNLEFSISSYSVDLFWAEEQVRLLGLPAWERSSKWEYHIEDMSEHMNGMARLNELGAERWEVCHVDHEVLRRLTPTTGNTYLLFKRPAQEA